MTDRPAHLFIYGTLLAAADHPMGRLLAANARPVGRGSIRARLYVVHEVDAQGPNSYPAAVPSPHPEDRVHGEVHAVTGDPGPLFAAFDDYEACAPGWPEPYEFLLREIDVAMADGGTLRAGCYLYTWDTSRADPVPSGRFTGTGAGVR